MRRSMVKIVHLLVYSNTQAPSAMSPKQKYIDRIRSESFYPIFRSLVRMLERMLFILGASSIFAGLLFGSIILTQNSGSSIVALLTVVCGVFFGLVCINIGKVVREMFFMLADVADSITDLNSRYEQQ